MDLRSIVRRNRRGERAGVCSVCSANPYVLEAAVEQALKDGTLLCVESTSNQVNQYGGYTGQEPAGFAGALYSIADRARLPRERVLLGGDHLGPYPWRKEPAASAMEKARELVRRCVLAGYGKIHLDASMACGDDPAAPLDEKVVATRSALMCEAAEQAHAEVRTTHSPPLYVIGTEVPVPGGEQAGSRGPAVTCPEDAARTLDLSREAFRTQGIEQAWERVVGLVVQPGVEFGDDVVFDYDRDTALPLSSSLPAHPELVYEAHSTDYQTPAALRRMVEDHFGILKVGPWLTFAFREAVFALSAIEKEWLGTRRGVRLSQVQEALEEAMLRTPEHWRAYYTRDEAESAFARRFSYSDRIRYYWPDPGVQDELRRLFANLSGGLPLTLLSQFLPAQYEAVREGSIPNSPESLARDRVRAVLRVYRTACGSGD